MQVGAALSELYQLSQLVNSGSHRTHACVYFLPPSVMPPSETGAAKLVGQLLPLLLPEAAGLSLERTAAKADVRHRKCMPCLPSSCACACS